MERVMSHKKQAVYNAVCLLLACITLFSAIMTGTLAWNRDLTQVNEFIGEEPVYTVTLQKYERDIFGEKTTSSIENAEFYLYKEESGDDVQMQIEGRFRFTTDADGKITVPGLLRGSYYFLETDPTYVYDFDGGKDRYDFTIDRDTDRTQDVAVTAYNQRRSAGLIISKTVENADGLTDGQKEKAFTFTVTFSDGGTYKYKIGDSEHTLISGGTLTLSHNQTAAFEALPVGVQYTVTEASADDYYISASNHHGNITREDSHADFVNTYSEDEPQETTLTVKKQVDGIVTDREFHFVLSINGEETPFSIKDGETQTFTVPAGAIYSVYEDDALDDGFALVSLTNGYGTAFGGTVEVVAVNRHVGTEMTQISGKKIWDTASDPSVKLPDYVTVYLMDGGRVVESRKVTAADNWQYIFDSPKFRPDGEIAIIYTVDETEIESYEKSIDGLNITNTYIKPATYDPPVSKRITGDAPAEAATFKFRLTAQNGAPMPEGSSGVTKTNTITGAGETEFGDITFTRTGTYIYTISEVKENAENYIYDEGVYTLTVTVEQQGKKLTVKSAVITKGNSTYNKAEFTNIYTKPESATVKVSKQWVGENGDQPGSVQVQLYKNGAIYGEPVTLDGGNSWSHVWNGLDKDAVWTVDEPSVPARYTKQVTGSVKDGFVITNTFDSVPSSEKITISGAKTWYHGDNAPSNHPASITVYVKNGDNVVVSKQITAKEYWYWSFTLDKYDAQGNEIVYTIDEAPVPGYIKYVNGYNIVNSHESYTYITIEGTKTWDHGANATRRPDSITVQVKAGDTVVGEKLVTSGDGWKYAFKLPRFDNAGREIAYTVGEANVPYYTMTQSGYDLKNVFKGYDYPGDSPKTGDSSNMWLWMSIMTASMMLFVVTLIVGRKNRRGRHSR